MKGRRSSDNQTTSSRQEQGQISIKRKYIFVEMYLFNFDLLKQVVKLENFENTLCNAWTDSESWGGLKMDSFNIVIEPKNIVFMWACSTVLCFEQTERSDMRILDEMFCEKLN